MNKSLGIIYKGIKVFVALVGIFIGNTLYAQQVDKPYKTQLLLVESSLKSGNISAALMEMDRITEAYPDAAEVFYGKALLLAQVGNQNGAMENAKFAYEKEKSLLYGNYLIELYKNKGSYEDAILVAKELYVAYPNSSMMGRNYLAILSDAKKIAEAENIYQQEIKKGLKSDTLDLIMAESYLLVEQYADAKKLLLPIYANQSNMYQVFSMLGFAYSKEKNYKKAIEVLESGIARSKEPLLYLDLADNYKNDSKIRQSYESLKKAFDSDKVPFADKYRVMMAVMNTTSADFTQDQAQALANSLVLVHPRVPESHILKGEILWKRGNIAEARSLFLTAVGMNPRHIDAWRLLINSDISMNQPESGVQHGKEALVANPNNPLLLYFTGLAYFVDEDYDNSRRMLESALNLSEQENTYVRSMVYSTLGDLYHQLKLDAASDVAYEEAIVLDSTNVSAMNNLAYYLSIRNTDLEKAAKYAKLANELEPNSGTFQDTYAWVLFKQGNYKESLIWMEKAMKSTTEPSSVLLEHYGDVLSKLNKNKDAVRNWEKALALSTSTGEKINKEKIEEKIKKKSYVE